MPVKDKQSTKDTDGQSDGSGLDRVREELTKYLSAKANSLVSSAGKKTGELAEKALPGDAGGLAKPMAKVLKGEESPAKAVGGQVTQAVKDKTVGKVKELFGGGGKAGEKKVTNIIETLDVGLPLRRVYDHWTEFEEFSSFMKGVVEASRNEDDDVTSKWTVKVGPSKRSWEATILEQVPDERIVWEAKGETSTHGSVSFHELAHNLTRVVVVVEYSPSGFLEKTANLWRAQGRRLRLDLKHFLRYVTLGVQEVPEGWRGEIREGELVRSHEDALAAEEEEQGQEGEEGQEEGESEDYEERDEDEEGEGDEEGDEDDEAEGEYEDEEEDFEDEEDEGEEEEGR